MIKKNIIITISALILIAAVTMIILKYSWRFKEVKSEVIVTFPKNIKGVIPYRETVFKSFSDETNRPLELIIDDSKSYLDTLKVLLQTGNSDIFYVVNSHGLTDPLIAESLYDFKIRDWSLHKLKKNYTTFSDTDSYFTYIPITWAPWGIYYNKAVFKSLGIKEPTSFSEFEEACNKILQNNIVPFSMIQGLEWPLTSWFDYLSIRINDSSFHKDLLAGLVDFTSEEVKNIFYALYGLIEDGWFNIDPSSEWTNMVSTIISGETSMALSSTFFYDEIPLDERQNIGWFPFPNIKNRNNYEIVTSSGFLTNGISHNIEGVKEFYKYILGNRGQDLIFENTNLNPVNYSIIKKTERDDLIKGYKNLSKSKELLPSLERNTNSDLIIPIKGSLNMLFKIESKKEIELLLERLENIREESI